MRPVGTIFFVSYGEVPPCVHTRLLLAHVEEHDYAIATPDMDVYIETIHPSNPDLTSCVQSTANGGVPAGVNRRHVYAFSPMTAAEYARLCDLGRREADAEKIRRGLHVGVGGGAAAPAAAGAPAAPVAMAVDGHWVLVDALDGRKVGERVDPPAGFPQIGDFGMMQLADSKGVEQVVKIRKVKDEDVPGVCEATIQAFRVCEAVSGDDRTVSDDVRTLEVRYGWNGERLRNFRDTVKELHQVEFSDFPLNPRTALEYVRAIAAISESAVAQHHMWVGASRIPEGDRSVYEDETLARILDTAINYDALNIANLGCMELVVRRRQLIADAHSQSPGMPSYMAADHYMGQTYRSGGAIVTPALTDFVSKQMAAQSAILKEKRKLEENKGKGKKGNPKAAPKSGSSPSA